MLCIVCIAIMFSYLAPGAPHNVTFKNLSSTSLYLLWDSPPPDEHNGIIRFYQIHLTENETGLFQEYRTTNNVYFVDRLHPYYHYILQVQAVTVLPGEQSDTLYITTLQDSKFPLINSFYAFIIIQYLQFLQVHLSISLLSYLILHML